MKYKHYNSWKRYASKRDLKIFKFSAETTCSGRLFHVDTFLVANECFLRLFRVRSTINFLLCPRVRVSVEGLKIPLSYILNMKMRSPRSLRASWLVKLRLRLRSECVITLNSGNSRLNRFCILSISAISPTWTGFHNWTQYSRWGRTCVLYIVSRNLGLRDLKDLLIVFIWFVAFLQALASWPWNLRLPSINTPRSDTLSFLINSFPSIE